jgi:hypothetical protein
VRPRFDCRASVEIGMDSYEWVNATDIKGTLAVGSSRGLWVPTLVGRGSAGCCRSALAERGANLLLSTRQTGRLSRFHIVPHRPCPAQGSQTAASAALRARRRTDNPCAGDNCEGENAVNDGEPIARCGPEALRPVVSATSIPRTQSRPKPVACASHRKGVKLGTPSTSLSPASGRRGQIIRRLRKTGLAHGRILKPLTAREKGPWEKDCGSHGKRQQLRRAQAGLFGIDRRFTSASIRLATCLT